MYLHTDPPPFLQDEPLRTGPLLFLRSINRVLGRAPLWLLPTLLLPALALPAGPAQGAGGLGGARAGPYGGPH